MPGAVWVDVEEVLRATPANPASLSLLDGDLLEDLDGVDSAFDAWLSVERERLRDHARTVAETLLREQSDPETAIPAAQQLLSIDRAHEGAWRALMRAHAADEVVPIADLVEAAKTFAVFAARWCGVAS